MTAKRLLQIRLLLTHPCGVCPNWTKQLVQELEESIVLCKE